MKRRAKIAGTLGPACDEAATLDALIDAGLDVARLNFSHGDAAAHRKRVRRLREAAARRGAIVALLGDLQGPRLRVGEIAGGELELRPGRPVRLLAGHRRAPPDVVPVSYKALARDVRRGATVLLDDGKLRLRVERVRGDEVLCEVERGGKLTDHKGINLPGSPMSVPALTPKDRRDLAVAVELGVDWLAISFVREAGDVRRVRQLLERAGAPAVPVMAKIERPEAIDRLDAIVAEADGVLVARGDLGVELPPQKVPVLQKEIIEKANAAGKPVVTATQMLDSMRGSPTPTRAEASDVANAVLDGSGCLLLTAETAVGRYPVESVKMMADIIEEAEGSGRVRRPDPPRGVLPVAVTTALAGCRAAVDVGARYLVVFTQSGSTARLAARFRPAVPILAFTPSSAVARQLALFWGTRPQRLARRRTVEELMREVDRALLEECPALREQAVVVLSGSPLGVPGTTNLMQVHRVGRLMRGQVLA